MNFSENLYYYPECVNHAEYMRGLQMSHKNTIHNPTKEQLRTLKGIIYLIRNKINSKCYIGQTVRTFNDRYKGNYWWKYTSNTYLKRAIQKYGKENFELIILENEIFDQDILNGTEFYYQNLYNSLVPNGYNLQECGGNTGKHHELSVMKRCKKEYVLINPKGELIKFKNIAKFCRENNLCKMSLWLLMNNKISQHKNWTKYNPNDTRTIEEKRIKYIVKSKNNETFNITNVKNFCKEHGLGRNHFYKLLNGKALYCKEFSLVENRINPNILPKEKQLTTKIFLFINPKGTLQKIENLRRFCKENLLNYQKMLRTRTSKREKSYLGWTLYKIIEDIPMIPE